MQPPPLDDSVYNYTPLRPVGEEEIEMIDSPIMTNSSVFLSSSGTIPIKEKKIYRKRWTWFKYLCWMTPIVWSGMIYFIQFFYGIGTLSIPNLYQLSVYNIVSGFFGMIAISIQVYENWFYVKPIQWIQESEYEDKPESTLKIWTLFICSSLVDTFLFVWTFVGSLWALQLYGSDLSYEPAMFIFSIINLIYQWSKYGFIRLSIKLFLSYKALNLLRII